MKIPLKKLKGDKLDQAFIRSFYHRGFFINDGYGNYGALGKPDSRMRI